jgi:hypothetical protein
MKFHKVLFIFILLFIPINSLCLAAEDKKYEVLPIDFTDDIPYINLLIENTRVRCMLDTGAATTDLALPKDVLSTLKTIKLTSEKKKATDLTGKIYTFSEYSFPRLFIGKLLYTNLVISENYNWGLSVNSTNDVSEHYNTAGVVGLNLFKDKKIIIDYNNKKFVIIEQESSLPTEYDIENWEVTPFKLDDEGISLYAAIDKTHIGRFILDTGANKSLIKPTSTGTNKISSDCDIPLLPNNKCAFIETKKFSLENRSLGKTHFYLHDFPQPTADGILGGDFLANKIIYLDLKKQIMRIKII